MVVEVRAGGDEGRSRAPTVMVAVRVALGVIPAHTPGVLHQFHVLAPLEGLVCGRDPSS